MRTPRAYETRGAANASQDGCFDPEKRSRWSLAPYAAAHESDRAPVEILYKSEVPRRCSGGAPEVPRRCSEVPRGGAPEVLGGAPVEVLGAPDRPATAAKLISGVLCCSDIRKKLTPGLCL